MCLSIDNSTAEHHERRRPPGTEVCAPGPGLWYAGCPHSVRAPNGLLAPTGRAPGLQPGSSRFESEAVHGRDEGDVVPRLVWAQERRRSTRCIPTNGSLAHQAERRREVPQARGSSPRRTTRANTPHKHCGDAPAFQAGKRGSIPRWGSRASRSLPVIGNPLVRIQSRPPAGMVTPVGAPTFALITRCKHCGDASDS
jgi:hypothetical protein